MAKVVIHFPWLHPKLGCGVLPDGVAFFDPGMPLSTDSSRWSPPDLPLSVSEVRSHLRSYLDFAEQFPKASDMKAYQAIGLDNFFTDTTMDIRSQLTGGAAPSDHSPEDERRQAQLVLALALLREEQFVAMREQESRFESAREDFAQVLGLDDDETFADMGVSDEAIFPRASAELPWRNLLGPLLRLVPEDAAVFVSDPDVVRELMALDLSFEPCLFAEEELSCCQLDAEALQRVGGGCFEQSRSLVLMVRPLNL